MRPKSAEPSSPLLRRALSPDRLHPKSAEVKAKRESFSGQASPLALSSSPSPRSQFLSSNKLSMTSQRSSTYATSGFGKSLNDLPDATCDYYSFQEYEGGCTTPKSRLEGRISRSSVSQLRKRGEKPIKSLLSQQLFKAEQESHHKEPVVAQTESVAAAKSLAPSTPDIEITRCSMSIDSDEEVLSATASPSELVVERRGRSESQPAPTTNFSFDVAKRPGLATVPQNPSSTAAPTSADCDKKSVSVVVTDSKHVKDTVAIIELKTAKDSNAVTQTKTAKDSNALTQTKTAKDLVEANQTKTAKDTAAVIQAKNEKDSVVETKDAQVLGGRDSQSKEEVKVAVSAKSKQLEFAKRTDSSSLDAKVQNLKDFAESSSSSSLSANVQNVKEQLLLLEKSKQSSEKPPPCKDTKNPILQPATIPSSTAEETKKGTLGRKMATVEKPVLLSEDAKESEDVKKSKVFTSSYEIKLSKSKADMKSETKSANSKSEGKKEPKSAPEATKKELKTDSTKKSADKKKPE